MDGIIVVNKPKGITSRDVVNKACKLLNTKKIGHTGTLDPIATGVLVLCVGKATKLVEVLTKNDKEYIATVKLGILTDTLDTDGTIIEKKQASLDKNELENVLKSFIGMYNQEVPIYSAVKINGKKLYEYAREKRRNYSSVFSSFFFDGFSSLILSFTNTSFLDKFNLPFLNPVALTIISSPTFTTSDVLATLLSDN